jgi:hypothetical protein
MRATSAGPTEPPADAEACPARPCLVPDQRVVVRLPLDDPPPGSSEQVRDVGQAVRVAPFQDYPDTPPNVARSHDRAAPQGPVRNVAKRPVAQAAVDRHRRPVGERRRVDRHRDRVAAARGVLEHVEERRAVPDLEGAAVLVAERAGRDPAAGDDVREVLAEERDVDPVLDGLGGLLLGLGAHRPQPVELAAGGVLRAFRVSRFHFCYLFNWHARSTSGPPVRRDTGGPCRFRRPQRRPERQRERDSAPGRSSDRRNGCCRVGMKRWSAQPRWCPQAREPLGAGRRSDRRIPVPSRRSAESAARLRRDRIRIASFSETPHQGRC